MPVTPKRARERALSFENTSSAPHFDRIAFRTPRRIFATLALNGADMNFMLDLAQQKEFCERAPEAIAPVPGGWGRMGWTHCDLKKVPARTFDAALQAAHARANAPKPKRARAPRSKKF
jgi:hypothetical protein